MIGDSLLATPLYGNDFETAGTRDIYLPAGIWIDYDTGKKYQGPNTLPGYPLPPGKTPLFVGGTGIVVEKRGGSWLRESIQSVGKRTRPSGIRTGSLKARFTCK